ncbi:putative glyoxylate/hydroxypyruvate reductase B [Clostridiales bacterium oral taxon 876 str. F0540]|nr:putative glyoxylate/hydroxypyruvate reductase B [Clostridiales bacterium oral taxon 876 str. F0540]
MNKPKVYIASSIHEEVLNYISKYCDYEIWDKEGSISRDELKQKLKDKAGVMHTGIKIDEDLLQHAPNLKVVSNITVGYNNFDIDAMKKRKVIGTNTPYVLDDTVADLIFGLILSAARRITELDRYVKDGNWKSSDDKNLYGTDVHHTTLGIIGMGRIGEAVAKRAKLGFDMDVIYYNRKRKEETEKKLGVRYSDMDTILGKSDFIVLMTPLTKDTYHMLDAEQFNKMKNTAIFINASRGQTVNEEALTEALINKKILAAGLDVYEIEPVDKENPLLKMKNVVALPHIGSATARTRFDMAMTAAENLVKGVLGEVPKYVVPELKDLI